MVRAYRMEKDKRITTAMTRMSLRVHDGKALVYGDWHEAEAVDPEKRGGVEYEVWVENP